MSRWLSPEETWAGQSRPLPRVDLVEERTESVVDLGCGAKKEPGAFGVDFHIAPGVDRVVDLARFPWPFASDSFDRAVSHQLLEHLPQGGVGGRDLLFQFFDEVHRILRPGGTFAFDTPHCRGKYAFGDVTHRRFYNEVSFTHFWDPSRDPHYPRKIWRLESLAVHNLYDFGVVNDWHVRRYAPAVDRLLKRLNVGQPTNIVVVLRKEAS